MTVKRNVAFPPSAKNRIDGISKNDLFLLFVNVINQKKILSEHYPVDDSKRMEGRLFG